MYLSSLCPLIYMLIFRLYSIRMLLFTPFLIILFYSMSEIALISSSSSLLSSNACSVMFSKKVRHLSRSYASAMVLSHRTHLYTNGIIRPSDWSPSSFNLTRCDREESTLSEFPISLFTTYLQYALSIKKLSLTGSFCTMDVFVRYLSMVTSQHFSSDSHFESINSSLAILLRCASKCTYL